MPSLGLSLAALGILVPILSPAGTVRLSSCNQGARSFLPCELSFNWQSGELPSSLSPFRDELLNVEFRSPRATTYLLRAFWEGGSQLRVRFTPTEPGAWTFHVTSPIKRFNDQESTFTVSDSGIPGLVDVANLRHWWTTNKQPHLWFAAAVPFFDLDQPSLEAWLDARKRDGFTHIRGTLLTMRASTKPVDADGQPNFAYFDTLDDRILAAETRGFTVDLILADQSFLKAVPIKDWDRYESLMQYLLARYGGLNITWQGVERFETTPGARTFLQQLGALIKKLDSYRHPRSTDARDSSSPLLPDGWMNFLIEASPSPELGAVEHQFTEMPEIHVVTATDPTKFRNELWNCTTNAEYPSISYESLREEANVKAAQTWFKVVSDTRHWELEPYFDVDGARAVGLQEVEYLAYAEQPGIVEITLPKHKYNPSWVNPISGEEIPLKDYKGQVLNRQTPDSSHDWVLSVRREGHKESMLKSYRFESQAPPVQEVELDSSRIPFEIVEPSDETFPASIPTPYKVKIARPNRASRTMEYAWWGEVVESAKGPDARRQTSLVPLGGALDPGTVLREFPESGEGARLLGLGSFGNFNIPKDLLQQALLQQGETDLHVRLQAINANGKAYQIDKVYRLTP